MISEDKIAASMSYRAKAWRKKASISCFPHMHRPSSWTATTSSVTDPSNRALHCVSRLHSRPSVPQQSSSDPNWYPASLCGSPFLLGELQLANEPAAQMTFSLCTTNGQAEITGAHYDRGS